MGSSASVGEDRLSSFRLPPNLLELVDSHDKQRLNIQAESMSVAIRQSSQQACLHKPQLLQAWSRALYLQLE